TVTGDAIFPLYRGWSVNSTISSNGKLKLPKVNSNIRLNVRTTPAITNDVIHTRTNPSQCLAYNGQLPRVPLITAFNSNLIRLVIQMPNNNVLHHRRKNGE
ncbi:hypothetical protein BLA29_015002, partial [Euroglyphus maynei]